MNKFSRMKRSIRSILIVAGIIAIIFATSPDSFKRVRMAAIAKETGEGMSKHIQSSLSSTVNVYDISKTDNDTTSCIKTKTPTIFTICTYEENEDMFVSGDIQRTGQWEGVITKFIDDLLKQDRNITLIDIGANIGYYSLLAASVDQHVVAVEPLEWNVRKLAKSIHANNFRNKIYVLNNAVSNSRQVVRIDVSLYDNMGAARLVSEREILFITDTIAVKSIVLNDIAEFIHTKDVVIKLDIEGHECRALEKSVDIFEKFNVLLIIMEWKGMQNLKRRRGVACRENNIQEMVHMLTSRDFIPYGFINNLQLDPKINAKWTNNDVYWKPMAVQH